MRNHAITKSPSDGENVGAQSNISNITTADKSFVNEDAAYTLCKRMTRAGYMCGVLGDDSEEFIKDQAADLRDMNKEAFLAWVQRNSHNMLDAHVSYFDILALYISK